MRGHAHPDHASRHDLVQLRDVPAIAVGPHDAAPADERVVDPHARFLRDRAEIDPVRPAPSCERQLEPIPARAYALGGALEPRQLHRAPRSRLGGERRAAFLEHLRRRDHVDVGPRRGDLDRERREQHQCDGDERDDASEG
jgi:hypothetical protein